MKQDSKLLIVGVVLICMFFFGWNSALGEQPKIEAPLMTGKVWTQMSQHQKTAYIWGVGDVVDLEQEIMEIYPELKRESFVTKAVEGVGDVTMNDIVATVDKFYAANPDKVNLSVIRVVWDTMIKPNIKTGIAGKPLD